MEGSPPAAAAYKNGKIAGYVFATSDIGYSGKPIKILVGLDIEGTITGAKVTEHHEPILLIGIPQERLFEFVGRYVGRNVIEITKPGQDGAVDIISGATVTAVVINDALPRHALEVAKSRGIAGFKAPSRVGAAPASQIVTVLANIPFEALDWPALLGDGSVRRLHLSNAEADAAFKKIGVGSPEPYGRAGNPADDFIDLYLALFSVETIGRSLFSPEDYAAAASWLEGGQAAIIVAANGDYSFRGSGFVRGGIFDRLQLVQSDMTILFTDKNYRRLDRFAAAGAPEFKEIALFRIPKTVKFDPAQPFRLELLAQRPVGPIKKAYTSFSLPYQLPARLLATKEAFTHGRDAGASRIGRSAHHTTLGQNLAFPRDRHSHLGGLALRIDAHLLFPGLAREAARPLRPAAHGLFAVQRPLAGLLRQSAALCRQRLHVHECGFLGLPLGAISAGASHLHAVVRDRGLAPLLGPRRVLWLALPVRRPSRTAQPHCATTRRPAVCSALCVARAPLGAEVHPLPRAFRRVARQHGAGRAASPKWSHSRTSYFSTSCASGPSWSSPWIPRCGAFHRALLLPLPLRPWRGARDPRPRAHVRLAQAAQAVRLRVQLCAKNCMVQAIHPLGQINPNECLYCMHCQVIYWDDHVCPPLVMKRERARQEIRNQKPETAKELQPAS